MDDEVKGVDLSENLQFNKTEEAHVVELIKRILTTRRGERVGDLQFGSDLTRYIFMPEISAEDVVAEIKNSIERNDSRLKVEEVTIKSFKEDILTIDLTVNVLPSNTTISTTLSV